MIETLRTSSETIRTDIETNRTNSETFGISACTSNQNTSKHICDSSVEDTLGTPKVICDRLNALVETRNSECDRNVGDETNRSLTSAFETEDNPCVRTESNDSAGQEGNLQIQRIKSTDKNLNVVQINSNGNRVPSVKRFDELSKRFDFLRSVENIDEFNSTEGVDILDEIVRTASEFVDDVIIKSAVSNVTRTLELEARKKEIEEGVTSRCEEIKETVKKSTEERGGSYKDPFLTEETHSNCTGCTLPCQHENCNKDLIVHETDILCKSEEAKFNDCPKLGCGKGSLVSEFRALNASETNEYPCEHILDSDEDPEDGDDTANEDLDRAVNELNEILVFEHDEEDLVDSRELLDRTNEQTKDRSRPKLTSKFHSLDEFSFKFTRTLLNDWKNPLKRVFTRIKSEDCGTIALASDSTQIDKRSSQSLNLIGQDSSQSTHLIGRHDNRFSDAHFDRIRLDLNEETSDRSKPCRNNTAQVDDGAKTLRLVADNLANICHLETDCEQKIETLGKPIKPIQTLLTDQPANTETTKPSQDRNESDDLTLQTIVNAKNDLSVNKSAGKSHCTDFPKAFDSEENGNSPGTAHCDPISLCSGENSSNTRSATMSMASGDLVNGGSLSGVEQRRRSSGFNDSER